MFVVREGKAHRHPVEVGPLENGRYVVTHGLRGGERVIIHADGPLAHDDEVRVVE